MAYPYHTSVTLKGFHQEYFHLTMNISGQDEAADGSFVGRAISLDPSRPNTARLAADGDVIIGRLASFENRRNEGTVVGAVEFRFSNTLPVLEGETVSVGDTVVGAGDGFVKAAAAGDHNVNFVAEVETLPTGERRAVVVKF